MKKTNLILDSSWEHEASGNTQLTWGHTDLERTHYRELQRALCYGKLTAQLGALSSAGSTQLLGACSYREHAAPHLKACSYGEATTMGNTQVLGACSYKEHTAHRSTWILKVCSFEEHTAQLGALSS